MNSNGMTRNSPESRDLARWRVRAVTATAALAAVGGTGALIFALAPGSSTAVLANTSTSVATNSTASTSKTTATTATVPGSLTTAGSSTAATATTAAPVATSGGS